MSNFQYCLGYPGPQEHKTMSGVDVSTYLVDRQWKLMPVEIQGISVVVEGSCENMSVRGSLLLLLGANIPLSTYERFSLLLQGNNEYGHMCWTALQGINPTKVSFGISIDDIAADLNVTYTAKSWTGYRMGYATNNITEFIDEENKGVAAREVTKEARCYFDPRSW